MHFKSREIKLYDVAHQFKFNFFHRMTAANDLLIQNKCLHEYDI